MEITTWLKQEAVRMVIQYTTLSMLLGTVGKKQEVDGFSYSLPT